MTDLAELSVSTSTRPPATDQTKLPLVSPTAGGGLKRGSSTPHFAFGFNYGYGPRHPARDYLDYPSDAKLAEIDADFQTARELGATVLRIRAEPRQILKSATECRPAGPWAMRQMLDRAEAHGLYIDVTGLFAARLDLVPAWYDTLPNFQQRWDAHATFWRCLARACATSSAVLQYELASEPIAPGAPQDSWYRQDPEISYPQPSYIVKDPRGYAPSKLARMWFAYMRNQIRTYDAAHMISFGSLPTYPYSFDVLNIGDLQETATPHVYPEQGDPASAIATLQRFKDSGKPVILGETFSLHSDWQTVNDMLAGAAGILSGVYCYFDGRTPEEADYDADNNPDNGLSRKYAEALRGMQALRQTLCQNRCGAFP